MRLRTNSLAHGNTVLTGEGRLSPDQVPDLIYTANEAQQSITSSRCLNFTFFQNLN